MLKRMIGSPKVKRTLCWLAFALLAGLSIPVIQVVATRTGPITETRLMRMRSQEAQAKGRTDFKIDARWVDLGRINYALVKAVIAVEDCIFLVHHGFDSHALCYALKKFLRTGSGIHGTSTITNQTARNVFLTTKKSYWRKALEFYYSFLIERIWGKRRIMEVYLNVIEMGDGVFGCEAAALHHFGKHAADLSLHESILLAVSLRNPRRFSPALFTSGTGWWTKTVEESERRAQSWCVPSNERLWSIQGESRFCYAPEAGIQETTTAETQSGRMEKLKSLGRMIARECRIGKASGFNPLWHFAIHMRQGLRRAFLSSSPIFRDAEGGNVSPCHVFVHSLLLDGQKGFLPNPPPGCDFENWFITKDEFIAFLNDALRRGYVLVRARDLLAGRIRLPKDRIPLVLSVDGMNYYDRMAGFGFARRLDFANDGLRYLVQTELGPKYISDGDVPGVLEQFIQKHPEFSYDGARAIIGLTGSEGIFGYRNERDAAPVAKELKRQGYEFASHSWGHQSEAYNELRPNARKGIEDIEKWLAGVGKVVGDTDLFITPFGIDIRSSPILLHHLEKRGFRYFFSVGDKSNASRIGNSFFVTRMHLDGIFLRTHPDEYRRLFGDPEALYDRNRTIPIFKQKSGL